MSRLPTDIMDTNRDRLDAIITRRQAVIDNIERQERLKNHARDEILRLQEALDSVKRELERSEAAIDEANDELPGLRDDELKTLRDLLGVHEGRLSVDDPARDANAAYAGTGAASLHGTDSDQHPGHDVGAPSVEGEERHDELPATPVTADTASHAGSETADSGLHIAPHNNRRREAEAGSDDGEVRDDTTPYACVVPLDSTHSEWVALQCPTGHGNAVEKSGRFFKGLKGLRLHMIQVHSYIGREVPLNVRRFYDKYQAACCRLTHEEAIKIQRRDPSAPRIEMRFCRVPAPSRKPAQGVRAAEAQSSTAPNTHAQAKESNRPSENRTASGKRASSGSGNPNPKRRESVNDRKQEGSRSKQEAQTTIPHRTGNMVAADPDAHEVKPFERPTSRYRTKTSPTASERLMAAIKPSALSDVAACETHSYGTGKKPAMAIRSVRLMTPVKPPFWRPGGTSVY